MERNIGNELEQLLGKPPTEALLKEAEAWVAKYPKVTITRPSRDTVKFSSSERNIGNELEYLLGSRPTNNIIAEAEAWVDEHPTGDLSEWADEMISIGAL